MKTLKNWCLIACLSAISAQGIAQTSSTDTTKLPTDDLRRWSIGANGGFLTHWTPFNRKTNGDYGTPHEKFGYSFFVKRQILSSLGVQADVLFGKVNASKLNNFPEGVAGQDQSGYETNINWAADLRGYFTVPNLSLSIKPAVIVPYLTAGVGYMSYSTTVRNPPPSMANVPQPTSGDGKSWFLPIGIGFKIGVSRAVNIDLGYTVYSIRTNNFDGYKSGLNDHMSYAHLGIEYSFGKKNSRPLQNFSTVAVVHEEVKETAAQLQARLAAEEQKRLQNEKDMADDDNDGVANKYDKCPGTPVNTKVDGGGCPLPAITVVKEKEIVTQQDRRVIGDAIKNLEFAYGKAEIKERSYPTLDRVAELLIQKDFSLKLAGHTDSKGSMKANMSLSKARAQAVKNYLVSKGANASRIEATGYGSLQPIATNKTAKGRQMNRRVEFTLF
ncbi:OmpA family protein [Mucilaginibacter sp.]|uniref:OmpA family protein n=1 Tax=Mucilaginibacter sp. TaxID=1882438 RepID=UPI000CB88465|nr:OmpA family protein [Mucilaginibacter sp.]PLW91522.1 MAG: flagellar motor protein MotB [Mucilaginibacter sp.]HEK19778.1 OmpA family protein [Bacteroidota bacterium]